MLVTLLLCLGAHAQAEEGNFFGGLKLRGAAQMSPREDKLMPYYMGFAYEVGHNFSFGRMSAELGVLYKPGRNYNMDLRHMQNVAESPINLGYSVDNRKNMLNGMTLRVAYERPMDWFSLRGGLQFGALKFKQEYLADVGDGTASANGTWRDTYNGVFDKGGLSVSPFFGLSVPVMSNNFVEANFVLLNYTAAHYNHVAGTELGVQNPSELTTKRDYIKESGRLIPHLEVAFGFRF